jgi:hypothetical protein
MTRPIDLHAAQDATLQALDRRILRELTHGRECSALLRLRAAVLGREEP